MSLTFAPDRRHLALMFADSVSRHGTRPATRIREDDSWRVQTYDQLQQSVTAIARALVAAGVQRGDRVGLFANNCPEWTQTDLACLSVGAVPVPIYATSTPEQITHILGNSGTVALVAGGASELERVREARAGLPDLRLVVSMASDGSSDGESELDWTSFLATGSFEQDEELGARLDQAGPDDLASLIYTSGTTGDPKGVMLTHGALIAQIEAISALFEISPDDHSLCFLPLSHALERAWTTIVLAHGCMNTYLPNARQVAEMLPLAKPTLLVSVPKLYETVYRVAHQKAAASPVKKKIFDWAFTVGGQMQRALRKGKQPSIVWRSQLPLADKLVLKNVRDAIGGPKTVLACGGAAVRPEVEEFFSAAGVAMQPGYGLTEASPLVSFNAPTAFKVGSAGRVMQGGELAIGVDSEILYRGPNLMSGYWGDDEATGETIKDGWLHTGDAGYVDSDGFLFITDRIKDIIVTLGGKNVAPQPIEGLVLSDPLFEHAVLIGEGRPSLTMLVRPSLPHLEELASRLQVKVGDSRELADDPQVVEALKERVSQLTAKLPSHEQIRDLRASVEEFTMENGLLTPTLKVKRREVEKRFNELIEDMYTKISRRRRDDS
ncbi:AMP-dependent synthetase/ligase [Aestuariimicrobium ganziense]|uniref:AMP-dependent synthetase/ligase n=1 Tax=Aestuariimicrobium ganziense TaxID=2773677 RepID=UPI0019434D0F|nr:long-chain fatty acid--CoA ligase [Aestuariimicrobium ganziense]